jgi:hypothetical protein
MKMKQIGLLALMTLPFLVAGCSTTREPDYRPAARTSTTQICESTGMEVALDPFVEPQRTRQYFGINATSEGIGIVFVRVANNTSNQTFLVEKKNFELVPAGASSGQSADATTIQRSKAGGEATALLGAASGGLGGIGLMLGGASMISHATEIQRNFVGKEMPNQTLSPGRAMEGFVYFKPVPKNVTWVYGANMKINLPDIKTQQSIVMTVPLAPVKINLN